MVTVYHKQLPFFNVLEMKTLAILCIIHEPSGFFLFSPPQPSTHCYITRRMGREMGTDGERGGQNDITVRVSGAHICVKNSLPRHEQEKENEKGHSERGKGTG